MIKYNRWFGLLIVSILLSLVAIITPVIGQQGTDYKDPEGKYEMELPPNWQPVSYEDGAGKARVDIIYRDRSYGLLKITQETLAANSELEDFTRTDIEQNLRFRPGYVFNNFEKFIGENLRGQLLQFDFTQAGQPKKGRNYYLKGEGQTIWVLRFAGNRNVFTPLRHETDAIARSFKPTK